LIQLLKHINTTETINMPSFIKFASILAAAGLAMANTVTFKSLDTTDRTIIFTPNDGGAKIASVNVTGGADQKVDFPQGWIGNWYAVSSGAPDIPGMLGEVAFNGWNDITFFDVSAIVNPNDHHGVKEMWPANGEKPTSGCTVFPCNNAYYVWDDVQTKATQETDLICTLGDGNLTKRSVEHDENAPAFKRDFINGRWTR
jgi:hypothetical protein